MLASLQMAIFEQANALWAEGVASAEDIELGIKTTFGFRRPHEGPFLHFDLSGFWNWPKETRVAMMSRQNTVKLSKEALEKIKKRYAEGYPWFVPPEKLEEARRERDIEYIRRLKTLYWSKE